MFSVLKIVYLTNLFLVSFINFSVVDAILPIFVRHLKVRSGEHIGISPLTFNKVKPSVRDHLLFCDHSPSFDDFTILTHGNNKFLLEIKESLLINLTKTLVPHHYIYLTRRNMIGLFVKF